MTILFTSLFVTCCHPSSIKPFFTCMNDIVNKCDVYWIQILSLCLNIGSTVLVHFQCHSHSASSQETGVLQRVILHFELSLVFFLLLSLFCCCLVLTKTTQLDLQIDCGLDENTNLHKVKRLIQGNYTFYMTVIVLAYHICLYYRCNDFKCWLHCI